MIILIENKRSYLIKVGNYLANGFPGTRSQIDEECFWGLVSICSLTHIHSVARMIGEFQEMSDCNLQLLGSFK